MTKHLRDIIIFLLLVGAAFVLWNIFIGTTVIDIQLHDTYFVFGKAEWIFLIVGLTTFFYFLARAISRRFSTVWTNVGLLAGLIAVLIILTALLLMLMVVPGGMYLVVMSVLIAICIGTIIWLSVTTIRLRKKPV
jgi:hypothetical protein